jgi:hypothetical protein
MFHVETTFVLCDKIGKEKPVRVSNTVPISGRLVPVVTANHELLKIHSNFIPTTGNIVSTYLSCFPCAVFPLALPCG